MNIKAIRSDKIYRKMITATNEEKENIYRYDLMKPFEFKWQCIGIPLKAEALDGYDVVSAAGMGGDYTPSQITNERLAEIEQISDNAFWSACENSIRNTLEGFEAHGVTLPTQDYIFTVILEQSTKSNVCNDG